MGDEEAATLDGQFWEFSRLFDTKRDGSTITLYRNDYWMRQAKILDDRNLTMTDTGILFFKWDKTELNFEEWQVFLTNVCSERQLDQTEVENALTNCGLPGTMTIEVPAYRTFFSTYTAKSKMKLGPDVPT